MLVRNGQHTHRRRAVAAIVVVGLGLTAQADAASLKSLMQSMGSTTKKAKALAVTYDAAGAAAVLLAYADDAKAGEAIYATGTGAKAQDLRTRFARFSATVAAAQRSSSDRAGFKSAFGSIAAECRSCHQVYN